MDGIREIKSTADKKIKINKKMLLLIVPVAIILIFAVLLLLKKDLAGSIFSKKDIVFGPSSYAINYQDIDQADVTNISFFENDENWQGNGIFDYTNYFEGKSSIKISSTDHQPGVAFLEKDFDLENIQTIEFLMYISNVDFFETAEIKLGDISLANNYSYVITDLKNGWNTIRIPIDQFVNDISADFKLSDVKKIQFKIVSRPDSTIDANIDYLIAYSTPDFLNAWNTLDYNFLSLGKANDRIGLMIRNIGPTIATLKEIGAKDFELEASFIPKRNGRSGLFFRGDYKTGDGYYFFTGGVGNDYCILSKRNSKGWHELARSSITNYIFTEDKEYKLKITTEGNKIKGFLAPDGNNFEEIITTTDNDFSIGGVGLAALDSTYALISSLNFNAN